jgi:hypothetical protein
MTTVGLPEGGQPSQVGTEVADPSGPAVSDPGSRISRLRSPAVQGGLAFLIYLVTWWATAFRPVIEHPTRALLDQRSADPSLFVWGLGWWPHAIGHGLNPLYTNEIGSWTGHSLAWVTTVPPLALLASPLTVTAGPIVSFNLLAAIALPLSAWAAFLLCRRLTGQFWPALVGGAVFGFSGYEMNHGAAGQLNLAYGLLLPLLAYLVVVWREGSISSRRFVILAGLAMTLQFYLMMEVFADLTALLVISLLVGLALAGRDGRPEILRLARVVGQAYVIAVVLCAPYALYALTTKGPNLKHPTSLDLASLVMPRPQRTYGIAWLTHVATGPNPASSACYVGVPLLLLAVLLAVSSWSSKIVRFISCMLVLTIVVALGPALLVDGTEVTALPWGGVWRLPILRNADPGRLMLFAYLVLAVAAALYLAGPARRVPWARVTLAVLVVAFIALDTIPIKASSETQSVPQFISSGQYRHELSPGETVVVISGTGNSGMLWQSQSAFYMKIAGGYFTEGISHNRTDLPWRVENLANATPPVVLRFERFVQYDHIGAILVDVAYEPRWAGVFRLAGLVGHTVGGVIVYPTHGCQFCRNVTQAQLDKAAQTASQVSTATGG